MLRHHRPTGAFAFVVVGGMLLTVSIAGPVSADDYPSWDDVQNARQSEAATATAIDEIEGLLISLSNQAAELGREAQLRSEEYNLARNALDAAAARARSLAAQYDEADRQADESQRLAGQLVAQLIRTGGGSVTLGILTSPDADDFLASLGTVDKLTERTREIYERAIADRNSAEALGDAARAAEVERRALSDDAEAAFATAKAASDAAAAEVASQQAAADQLYEQLATLKGTTAEVEQRYLDGLVAQQPAPSPPVTPPGNPPGGGDPGAPGNPAPPSNPSPPSNPAPPSNPSPPNPSPPNPSAVDTAIAFASAQLGKPYRYGGSGPDSWDCSGLTRASYASAGVYIGPHSATRQYTTMANAGRLVPLSAIVPGDLIFYSDDGGATMYHVTLYIGGGRMIEAPYEGVPVRVTNLRYYDVVAYAGRPTG